ncbi:hypothetical protein CcaCcLH18_04990 [Colletotrichum camelliae]|nr:hypothetical protein CcaCcLH18_04990 [Colletotrichum camelliae]
MYYREILGLAYLYLAAVASAQCFLPNGTNRLSTSDVGKNTYKPCDSNGHSMCCNTYTGDVCRDGFCWNESSRVLWRESCTDPTWQSPKCLKLCIDSTIKVDANRTQAQTDIVVTQCADGTYCCGNADPARKCCQAGKGVRVVNGQVVASSSTTSSATASATASTSTADSSTSVETTTADTSDDTSSSGTDSNRAAIIGGAVGGTVGALLLIGGIVAFMMHRRKKKTITEATHLGLVGGSGSNASVAGGGDGVYFKEMSADQQRFELYGGTPPVTPAPYLR